MNELSRPLIAYCICFWVGVLSLLPSAVPAQQHRPVDDRLGVAELPEVSAAPRVQALPPLPPSRFDPPGVRAGGNQFRVERFRFEVGRQAP